MKVRIARPKDKTAVNKLGLVAIHLDTHDQTWVIEDGQILGVLSVTAVPGLPSVLDLAGGVHPDFRRQGVGSALWTAVRPQLPALGARQLSRPVTNLTSPAAQFLLRHRFYREHEEWLLHFPHLQTCKLANLPPSPKNLAIHPLPPSPFHLFLTLYAQSFGGTPWYQPYTAEELAASLADPADILFLYKDGRAIGFAWLQGNMIEPIGIVKGEQGQGYGRILLQATLQELKNRGKTKAVIGVWQQNETAVHLYQSLGFQHHQTITYLAYNL